MTPPLVLTLERLYVNYPWAHSNELGSLTLTSEEAWPRELALVLMPESVLPRNVSLTGATRVIVDARVTTCPPQPGSPPASVMVSFRLQAPQDGTPDAGGHDPPHIGRRPVGTFQPADSRDSTVSMCTVTRFDAQGTGSCDVPPTYHPPEVSGNVTIVAEAEGFDNTEKKVKVEVRGLAGMGEGSGTLVLVGAPENHSGTNDPCRPQTNPPSSRHSDNHNGQSILILVVEDIALRMFRETGILLRVTDMSLPQGGLFDINNDWRSPHSGHRLGLDVDIGFTGVRDGVCTSYNLPRLQEAILEIARRAPLIEGNHFHVRVR